MRTLVTPLRVRSTGEAGRKVTWLELFFDLIFVAAVAQVAEPLRDHYSAIGLVRFTPLFVLIWWAWTGHTVFSTRFDTDDVIQRGLTLVQMFAVAAMAANAKDALDSRSSAGFAAAYAAVRFILVAQYFRARHVPDARPLATRYLVGHGSAALLWLMSAFVPAPERFWIWGIAFAIDLGTPWLAVRHSVKIPPDAAHLPERFGLFTLILLRRVRCGGHAGYGKPGGLDACRSYLGIRRNGDLFSHLVVVFRRRVRCVGTACSHQARRPSLSRLELRSLSAVPRHRRTRRRDSAHRDSRLSSDIDNDGRCHLDRRRHNGHACDDRDRSCIGRSPATRFVNDVEGHRTRPRDVGDWLDREEFRITGRHGHRDCQPVHRTARRGALGNFVARLERSSGWRDEPRERLVCALLIN
jgi:hypothetical protein